MAKTKTTQTTPEAPAYRVRFVFDGDAQFEECNGEARPLTEAEYAGYQYLKDGAPVGYAEYLSYYGNPDRHVYIGAIVERRCSCCGHWETATSLWRIDMMDDDPDLGRVVMRSDGTRAGKADEYLTPEAARALPGYLGQVAGELLDEAARWENTAEGRS